MVYEFELKTGKEGFYNITRSCTEAVEKSGVREGICVVYCPHTTAGITINENGDPDVCRDLTHAFGEIFADMAAFKHCEGNSSAHVRASVVGCSDTVIIQDGRLVLGTWQSVFFAEFDGPRDRKYFVKIIEG